MTRQSDVRELLASSPDTRLDFDRVIPLPLEDRHAAGPVILDDPVTRELRVVGRNRDKRPPRGLRQRCRTEKGTIHASGGTADEAALGQRRPLDRLPDGLVIRRARAAVQSPVLRRVIQWRLAPYDGTAGATQPIIVKPAFRASLTRPASGIGESFSKSDDPGVAARLWKDWWVHKDSNLGPAD